MCGRWPQFNISAHHFTTSRFPRSTVGYFAMPMWLNCGLKIYLAETVMEEITLFINLEIKEGYTKLYNSPDPALWTAPAKYLALMYFSQHRICEAERTLITDMDCFSAFSWIWSEICHFWLFFHRLIERPPPREDEALESAWDWLISGSSQGRTSQSIDNPESHKIHGSMTGYALTCMGEGKKSPKNPILHHFCSSLQTPDIPAEQGTSGC